MKKAERNFLVKDIDCVVTVEFVSRAKEIFDYMEDYIYNLQNNDWFDASEDSFAILYKDGTFVWVDEDYEGQKIKRQHIASIVYNNPCTAIVYGNFEINEYGVVTTSFEEIIAEENIEEVFETAEVAEVAEVVESKDAEVKEAGKNEVDTKLVGSKSQVAYARSIQNKAIETVDSKIEELKVLCLKGFDTKHDLIACKKTKDSLLKDFNRHSDAMWYFENHRLFSVGCVNTKISECVKFLKTKDKSKKEVINKNTVEYNIT